MLTKHDELLCHQIAEPFDYVGDASLNFYERIHFPVMDTSGNFIIDVGFGKYANRNVIEGFAGVSVGDKTVYYVRASRELRPNHDVTVGPLSWEVIEGFKKLRCKLDENEYGISFDLLVDESYPPIDEPQHFDRINGRVGNNWHIYYQMGRPTGWLKVDGTRYEVTPENWRTNRDHSWGIRPSFGRGDPSLQPGERPRGGLYHFSYLQFEKWGIQHFLTEDADGNVTFFNGELVYAFGDPRERLKLVSLEHQAKFHEGSLRIKSGRMVFTAVDGTKIDVEMEGMGPFFPLGAVGGYGANGWRGFFQGAWMGQQWTDGGRLDMTDPDTFKETAGLYDNACLLRCGNEVGHGIVEITMYGAYKPRGISP